MDLATLANIPRRLDVAGASIRVSALTQREWATFQRWLEENVPRPAPPPGADPVERAAYRNGWPPSIASRPWFAAMDHPGAFARFVQVAVGKHWDGEMGDADALALAYLLVEHGKVADLVMACLGGRPIDPATRRRPEPDTPEKLPESDDPGEVYFQLAKAFAGWTHDDIMDLTFPQIRYYRSAGKPLETGARRYTSAAEARAARAQQSAGPATPMDPAGPATDPGSPADIGRDGEHSTPQ